MTTYLTVITTVLVLTQVIRVTQNMMQLRHIAETEKKNQQILLEWHQIANKLYEVTENIEKTKEME